MKKVLYLRDIDKNIKKPNNISEYSLLKIEKQKRLIGQLGTLQNDWTI